MGSSLRLGRLFGIPIEVNISWVFVFLLFTFLLAAQFDENRLRWPAAQRWGVAVCTVFLFFLSVLIHELSHSLMALGKGIPLPRQTPSQEVHEHVTQCLKVVSPALLCMGQRSGSVATPTNYHHLTFS